MNACLKEAIMPGEDFESIALGLKPTSQKKKTLQPNQHIPLSHGQMAILASAPQSDLYQVLLVIMEGVAQKLETEHMRHWKDKELFDRSGVLAVAAQLYFEAVQHEVLYQVNEFIGREDMMVAEAEAAEMTPQDFLKRSFGIDVQK
jgi:hypothetical protein